MLLNVPRSFPWPLHFSQTDFSLASLPNLDLEVRNASSGEMDRLFDVPEAATVERVLELAPAPVAGAATAVAAASLAAAAASQCDVKAGVDLLLRSVTLLAAVLDRFGCSTVASSSPESEIMRPIKQVNNEIPICNRNYYSWGCLPAGVWSSVQ